MTSKEPADDILRRSGYGISSALDEGNYREKKGVVIRALDLADGGNYGEALKCAEHLSEGLRAEVETAIRRKGGGKS
mgnify:CR=1 FL=1